MQKNRIDYGSKRLKWLFREQKGKEKKKEIGQSGKGWSKRGKKTRRV